MYDIILGGGLAGLIVKFYNPDYKIITKDIGGQFLSKFPLGPRFLRKTKETQRFVWDINSAFGIKIKEKRVKIGYWYENALHDTCSKELMKQYFLKSRNLKDAEIDIEKQGIMSNSENEFDAYDINYKEFAELMFSKYHYDFSFGNIQRVDVLDKLITTEYSDVCFVDEYHNLISTIPLVWFMHMVDTTIHSDEFKYSSIHFYHAKSEERFANNDYDYIYFPEMPALPMGMNQENNQKNYDAGLFSWYRISFLDNRKECVYEGAYDLRVIDGEIAYATQRRALLHQSFLDVGHVIDNDIKLAFPNVEFIGRMGKWKHSERLEKVVKDAQSMGI